MTLVFLLGTRVCVHLAMPAARMSDDAARETQPAPALATRSRTRGGTPARAPPRAASALATHTRTCSNTPARGEQRAAPTSALATRTRTRADKQASPSPAPLWALSMDATRRGGRSRTPSIVLVGNDGSESPVDVFQTPPGADATPQPPNTLPTVEGGEGGRTRAREERGRGGAALPAPLLESPPQPSPGRTMPAAYAPRCNSVKCRNRPPVRSASASNASRLLTRCTCPPPPLPPRGGQCRLAIVGGRCRLATATSRGVAGVRATRACLRGMVRVSGAQPAESGRKQLTRSLDTPTLRNVGNAPAEPPSHAGISSGGR